ncbi:MAG: hypothetical protein ACRC5T_09990, partial [Cetobacterium sp.]
MIKLDVDFKDMARTNSGNAAKIPKMFGKIFKLEVNLEDVILNHGAGRYQKHKEYLDSIGYFNVLHYDTDPKLDIRVIPEGNFDVIVSSNVLNCIPSKGKVVNLSELYVEDYIECLMTLVKERGVKKVLFTIYDGYNNNIGVRHVKTHTGSFQA